MDKPSAIVVKDLYKTFKLPHEQHSGVKQVAINLFNSNKGFELQKVLTDVSFEVKQGEFFGIVGKNGSGKSTLLKLLAGIYVPDKGLVQVNGSLTPFIELGVGFNPELTGRENVFLNGALLGFDRKQMSEMYDDIVSFAELEKFMDQKLKNYSSGMQVRLAFSIAIRAKSDILLIDEVLAVGDTAFQKKCFQYFLQLKKENRTVILVTHDMAAVQRFCDRAIVINKGKSSEVMEPSDATILYNEINAKSASSEKTEDRRWGSGKVKVQKVTLNYEQKQHPKNVVEHGQQCSISITTKSKKTQNIVVGLAIIDQFGVNISGPNSSLHKLQSNKEIVYKIPKLLLTPGDYRVVVAVFDEEVVEEYDHLEDGVNFTVVSKKELFGKVDMSGEWS